MYLYAPKGYWIKRKPKDCNGCGSEVGISKYIVPDTIYGLNVRELCCIHDYMYKHGVTKLDKVFADVMFLCNLVMFIWNKSNWIMRTPRVYRATTYALAVLNYGDDSFFHGKQKNELMSITFRGEFKKIKEIE